MPTAPGIRARNRAAIEDEIMKVASRHLAEVGAAGLSLRAIARDLDMVSSAIYRYVESRDELLTRLIISAYDSLGKAVEDAFTTKPPSPNDRFNTIARATRQWALANPHEYALLYGSPVPGYHAPPDRTNAAGTRVARQLVAVLVELAGDYPDEEPDSRLKADPNFADSGVGTALLQSGLIAWTLVLGAINAEIFEYFGPEISPDKEAHFGSVLDCAIGVMGRTQA